MKSMLLVGLTAALAQSAAAQSPPKVNVPFAAGDWIAACEWKLDCGALSLPEQTRIDAPADLFVRITRDFPAGAETLLTLVLTDEYGAFAETGGLTLRIDGDTLANRPDWSGSTLSLSGSEAADLLIALHGGQRLSVEDREGRLVATQSLVGLLDVLAHIDEEQSRDGTGDALVLQGRAVMDGTRVPPPPPRPIHTGDRNSLSGPSMPRPSVLSRLTEQLTCPRTSSARLDEATTLLLVTSECDGYDRQGIVALIDQSGEVIPAAFEPFNAGPSDLPVQPEAGGEAVLADPYWEDADGVLAVERKDRVFGDCGSRASYVWDITERRFRLAAYASLPVCRGVRQFITTYEAEVIGG